MVAHLFKQLLVETKSIYVAENVLPLPKKHMYTNYKNLSENNEENSK